MFNVTMWTNKSVGLKETLHGVKCDNDGSPASLADTVGSKEWPFFSGYWLTAGDEQTR